MVFCYNCGKEFSFNALVHEHRCKSCYEYMKDIKERKKAQQEKLLALGRDENRPTKLKTNDEVELSNKLGYKIFEELKAKLANVQSVDVIFSDDNGTSEMKSENEITINFPEFAENLTSKMKSENEKNAVQNAVGKNTMCKMKLDFRPKPDILQNEMFDLSYPNGTVIGKFTINLLEGLTESQKTIVKRMVSKGYNPMGIDVDVKQDEIYYLGERVM